MIVRSLGCKPITGIGREGLDTGGMALGRDEQQNQIPEFEVRVMSHNPSPLHIQRMGREKQKRITGFRRYLKNFTRARALSLLRTPVERRAAVLRLDTAGCSAVQTDDNGWSTFATLTKAQVYRGCDLANHHAFAHEIDHLMLIGLGGSNDIDRLWRKGFARHAEQLPLAAPKPRPSGVRY